MQRNVNITEVGLLPHLGTPVARKGIRAPASYFTKLVKLKKEKQASKAKKPLKRWRRKRSSQLESTNDDGGRSEQGESGWQDELTLGDLQSYVQVCTEDFVWGSVFLIPIAVKT